MPELDSHDKEIHVYVFLCELKLPHHYMIKQTSTYCSSAWYFIKVFYQTILKHKEF